MLFSGIEVPATVGLKQRDIPILEATAKKFGETADLFLEGAVNLLGIFGYVIEYSDFTPGIMFGVTNPPNFVSTFDIPSLVDEDQANIGLLSEVYKAIGQADVPAGLSVEVDRRIHEYLRIASGYYDRPILPLVSTCIDLRAVVLKTQNAGEEFIFSADQGESWGAIELD